jgi:hypothetical protein
VQEGPVDGQQTALAHHPQQQAPHDVTRPRFDAVSPSPIIWVMAQLWSPVTFKEAWPFSSG